MANDAFLRMVEHVARVADMSALQHAQHRVEDRTVEVRPRPAKDVRCAVCHDDDAPMFCACGTALHASCMIEFGCPSCGAKDEVEGYPARVDEELAEPEPLAPSSTTWPYNPMRVTSSDPRLRTHRCRVCNKHRSDRDYVRAIGKGRLRWAKDPECDCCSCNLLPEDRLRDSSLPYFVGFWIVVCCGFAAWLIFQ